MHESMLVKHVALFEINLNGHHSIYLEKISEAHLSLGRKVTAVVSEKYKNHSSLIRLNEKFTGQFKVVVLSEIDCARAMKSKFGDVGREIGLWKLFKKACSIVDAEQKVDFAFLPYADYCLNAIGLLGSPFGKIAWGGICMRPTFHFKDCGVIAPSPAILHVKRFLFMRVLRLENLNNLFSIDELLPSYISKQYPKLAKKLSYLPDPADPPLNLDATELRQRYKIPLNAKVILVYGAIDERKGIFNVLDALESSPVLGEWHALVVGRQSASVRDALSTTRWSNLKQSNRIHAMDEFVTDEVEHHVLAMCDVVWVAYVGHYTMSGVIVRAGMYRKPVIACKEGLIGWYARVKGVGLTVDTGGRKIPDVISRLNNAMSASKIGESGANQFCKYTWSNALTIILSI